MQVNPEWEIHPQDVAAKQKASEDFLLLDVRNEKEARMASIGGAKLVPLPLLAQQVDQLVDYFDKPVVVHCHHGGRSMAAARFLRERGFFNVRSMAGGIDAWSQLIDPTIPRY